MRYELFQFRRDDTVMRDLAFRAYDPDRPVELKHYHRTYAGTVEGEGDLTALEALYKLFNLHHPADFYSYSMSMADVVMLDGERLYYCDAFGFKRLEKGWQ